MHERMEGMQDEMEELVRKVRSQEETLSDLVKNKLDMEIQLNLRNFELQSLRQRWVNDIYFKGEKQTFNYH